MGIALKATGLKAAGLKGLISRVPFAFGDFVSFFYGIAIFELAEEQFPIISV